MILGIVVIFFLIFLMVIFPTRIKIINKILFLFTLIILILFAAFRDGKSVNDYELYVGAWYWASYEKTTIEASFIFIRDILRDGLRLHYLSIFIIYAILGVVTKLFAIKKIANNFYLAVLIYLSHFYILHELTQMRAGVAAGFILLAIAPLYNRNIKQFLFLTSIAIVFHYSAVLMLPLWFVRTNKNTKFLYYLVPIGIVFYVTGFNFIQKIPIPYFQTKLDTYQKLTEDGVEGYAKINVFNAFYLLRVLIFYFVMIFRHKIAEHSKYFYLLLRIEGISLFALPTLAIIPAIAYRVHEFLGIVELVLYPLIIYAFRIRIVGYFVVIMIALIMFCVNIFYNKLILF
ncbi:EpsG family protein [Kaistella montana]|uniref:EpsG family protein n=1 Tax=Kaistella montana TaxID=1849733 RepID=A0ABW5K815_9FLAO|nr:EpsG family protein [Kaistella montana]MCQ4035374.1 EpsG family protein [Kaistella montana]